jgi:hypothetical protein
MKPIIIAVDPGLSGAVAFSYGIDKTNVDPMPETMADIWDYFKWINDRSEVPPVAYLENVGGYMPGNSGPASVKFSRHIGHLEMALYAAEIPTTKVSPSTWMKALGVPPKLDKAVRKRWIKDAMQRKYPTIKVTLVNADALGILTYAIGELK